MIKKATYNNPSLWILSIMALCFFAHTTAFAQCEVTIEGAAVITVPSGTGFGTEGNITFQNSTGAIDNSGTVHISGNWTNNAASGGLINGSAGTVVLEGANQNIAGSAVTTFRNLTLAGTGIKTITAASATVTHVLNLADRELATGPNFLNISTTGSITYTVGSGFISSTAGGYLQRQTNATSLYHYPVGRAGGGLFRPIDISPATTTSNNFRVRQVSNNPTTDGYTATSTDATICSTVNTAFYHLITQTGTDNATLTMYFSSAIDGNYTRMAHWQAPGPIWTNMNPVTLNAGAYGHTNGISRTAWTNYTTPAFALALPLTPLAPAATAATTIACNSFTANWSASTDANHLSADITKYFLDVATDAGFSSMVSGYNNLDVGNVTSLSVTGLNTGTNYYYRVRAMNSCGTSSSSNVIGPVQTITASVAPTGLSAAASNPMCPGFNATLTQTGGSLGTGTSWKWYSDNTYTTLVGTGTGANASLVVNPLITTTYYLRIEGGTFPCTANLTGPVGGVTVTVQVIPTLAPLTGNQSIICGGTTVFSNFPTGGTITTSGGYRIHTFTSNGTFSVPSSFLGTVDVLVVGGGGGGGADMGGGGGGGGVIYNTGFAVTPGTNIAVTVGAGGSGAPNGNNVVRGTNGSPSIFSSITALGGGGGASRHDATNNPAGTGSGVVSSGGGASGAGTISGYGGAAGVGTAGQGNNGGGSIGTWYPGGGGGAGGAGGTNPANGGPGVSNSILGTAYYWGAGGGGAGYSNIAGNGGLGGGGGGAPKVSGGGLAGTGGLNPGSDGSVGVLGQQTNVPGGNGAPNTGAGGGGGAHYNNGNHGGAGGSGIVIVRYPDVTNGNWSSSNPAVATVNSSGVVTGVSPGTATITYQLVVGGCNSTAVVNRDVTVSLPTLAPITGTTSICAGSTTTLSSSPKATGGIESVVGGYRIHTFLSSGTLNVTRSGNMEVLVVAGGGGGGTNMGGGGGGGGVIANPSFPVSAGNITVTVGAGGAGAPAGTCSTSPCHPTVAGSNGGNSVFSTLTAIGGGRGGYSYNSLGTTAGIAGGSGGGASGYNDNGAAIGAITGGAGTPGQGFGGGYQGNAYYSGGGGGAGGVGSSGNSQAHGGPGVENSILGTSYYWGGGGGGSAYSLGTGGNGGIGGGGGGAVGVTTGGVGLNNGSPGGGGCSGCWANTPGGNGGANTGGGGGGGSHYYSGNKGGDGGSGIVVVKYLDGANGTWSSTNTGVATVDAATGVVTGLAAGSTTIKYTVTIGSCVAEQTTTVTVTDPPAPTSVTATPSAICTGGSSNLNATSSGNNINWYTQASGGISIGSSASGANFAVTPASTTTYYAETATILTGSQTFNYSGSFQTFTVPPLVTSITIDAYGAQGSSPSCAGGLGGRAQGTLAVTPGQVLTIYVGGQNGFNGGGRGGCRANCGGSGGGASDIRVGGTGLVNRVIVAGGGGGGGGPATTWNCGVGGVGGGATGGNGTGSSSNLGIGLGGTQAAGGGTGNGGCGAGIGGSGTLGQGGTGIDFSSWNGGGAGGGGGGYYGGGAGSYCGDGGGGGGGSSYTGGVTGGTTTPGVRSGNGQIIISWNTQGCLSATRTPVTVTVNPLPTDITPTAVASSVCTGSGTNIQIASSQSGVNYQLRNNSGNVNIGSPVAGTGGTINLPTGNLTATTTFNVLATNTTTTCFRQMTNTVTVTVYPYPMVGSISGSATVCEGYTTNLTIVPPAGGTVTNSGGYTIHTFTSDGSFNPPTTFTGTVEVLAVAGGGGGAGSTWGGGGGGGGGVIHHTAFPVTGGTPIAVTVGAGGTTSAQGGDSYFGLMRAFGGGGACSNCGPGGSGGGSSHSNPGGGNNPSTQTSNNGGIGYGNVGGNAVYAAPYWCGSGGGAGAAGCHGCNGGSGMAFSISGTSTFYAGGGGQTNNIGTITVGGAGGGGSGVNNGPGQNGTANTGGGGGGSRWPGNTGGTGGSGIVIVRYLTPPAGTWSSSNTLVATVNPTTGVVSGVSAGSATISYAVTVNGCTTTATYPITINATPAAPTSVVANPTTICTGGSSNLNAISSGNTIRWWDAPTGGTLIGTSASGVDFSVSPTTTTTYYAEAYTGSNCSSLSRVGVTVNHITTPSTPGAIIGTTSVCVGGTTTLSSPIATGGTITNVGGYRIHTFYSSGTLNIAQSANVEVLVVAGGGGGGTNIGGGGGGGGVIANPSFAVTPGSYPITVGIGGYGAPAGSSGNGHPTVPGANGGNSVFSSLTAIGGGRGGVSYNTMGYGIHPGVAGGSGGGATGYNNNGAAPGSITGGAGTVGQGFRGGHQGNAYYSGGGGGAGGQGLDGNNRPDGGPGILNSILGTAYYWGAGGGGAGHSPNGGNGGTGGGGGGASWTSVAGTGGASGLNPGANGTPNTYAPGGHAGANTGSGGGAGSHYDYNNPGGSGGSGIVVVRYLEGAGNGTWSSSVPSVATVNPTTGVVTGVSAGTTTISYTITQGICSSTPATTTVTVIGTPNAPTASNVAICTGGTTNISATSAGNLIKWYDAPTGGNLVGVTASGANLSVAPGSTTTYYAEAVANNPYATGGIITTSGAYRIHRFNSSADGPLNFIQGGTTEVLVVGGGGGGGADMGGGGGAGGVIMNNSFAVAIGSFPITVGNGGNGASAGTSVAAGLNGGNSSFSSLIAIGGGGGASNHNVNWANAGNGGSGGGGSGGRASNASYGGNPGTGTVGQGYAGAASGVTWYPGGGGGAGGPGSNNPAHGGPGIPSSILGTEYYFGGGGGGSGYSGIGGNGGKGGGGGGGVFTTLGGTGGLNNGANGGGGCTVCWAQTPGGNAGANTGGGGGGGSHYNSNNYGGNGGSGIVVVRYIDAGCSSPRTPVTVTVNPLPNDIAPTAASAFVCYNTGTNIQIAGSQSGVNYQLRNNVGNVNIGSPVAGTGGTINLPTSNLTATTTFNVLATNPTTTCQRQMTNTVTVTVWTDLTGGTFVYTNPTSCTTANGTVTVSGVSGGSGAFEYSINGGSSYQASASFTGIANGTSNTVWARNTASPYCAVNLGSFTMIGPYSPISAATATATPNNLCASNTPVLTASNMAPGNGGSNAANGAYSFNGSQYLAHSNTLGLPVGSVTTVEAWIKASASQADANYNGIVGWGPRTCCPTNPATTCLLSIKSDLRLSMATWGNDFVPGTGPSVVANVWTHVAMVINGNSVQFYINGQVAQSATLSTTPNIQTGANYITIGSTDVYGRLFNGSIDNVRIWASARTQAEIRGDMYREVPATGTVDVNTLRANYTFNSGTLNNYTGLSGPNLSVNNASQSYPNAYLYTWTGANDINDNPAQTNQEQVTVGPLQGISNFTVTAVTNPDNGCLGTASTLGTALVNDFTTTPYNVNYVAGASQAVNMSVAPAPVSGMMGKSVGIRKYFEPAAGNTAPWSACVNYGVPAVIPGVAGFGPCTVPGNLQALTYSTAAPTSLSTGVACFTGTVNFPTGMLVLMNGSSTTAPVPMAIRLTLTFKTTVGDNPIPLQYVSTGHLMIRANQNFYVHAIVEGIPLNPATYMYYGGTSTYSPQIACSTVSAGYASNTYIPFYDIYDCLIKAASPDACTAFGFDKFPVFDFTPNPVSATTPISICWGGTPASRFNLIGNTGAIPLGTTNCGGLSQSWLNANGTVINGTWSVATNGGGSSTPTAIVADAVTAPATPGTTYTYVVANGTSNICYGYATVNVSHNIPVADDVNFPMPANLTNITTHWQTGLIPDTWDPASRVSGNDNWYDNRNWTHCVPDINTNAMIYQNTNPGGANYQPIINTSGANVKAITIETDNGARLQINTVGSDMINIDQ